MCSHLLRSFSFVYLVEDGKSKYALKKVLSQLPETSQAARWEIQVRASTPGCSPDT